MRRVTVLALAAVAFSGLACLSSLPPQPSAIAIPGVQSLAVAEGKVVEMGADQFVFEPSEPGVDDIQFAITEATDFIESGAFIARNDIVEGERVRVVYELRSGAPPEAKRVEVLGEDEGSEDAPHRFRL